jgi:threonine synthase
LKYLSTRGGMPAASFKEILLGGLAPDGGLSLCESYPQVDRTLLETWRGLSYADLAFEILQRFAPDFGTEDLRRLIQKTYTEEIYGTKEITPFTWLKPGLGVLHLSNGPTLAFKDMAMQLLGNLFEHVLAETGQELNILGATSGDTGSAAEYAMRGKKGVKVFMLSPNGRMSAFQRAQMYGLHDENIFNIAAEGVFDDCQDMVKAVSNDLDFKRRYAIGTVNSINWGRIVAQVVYYFKGYFAATKSSDERVSFCVPSGNFGNVLAGHIARMMGLPIAKLIVATNENDVLAEFFETGRYRVRASRETYLTSSPSMDISKASNFERFVFDLVGRDPKVLSDLWKQVDTQGWFDLGPDGARMAREQYGFISGRSDHAKRLATIRHGRQHYNYVMDPHTADGVYVAEQLLLGADSTSLGPLICLETALPIKFSETIVEAIGEAPRVPERFAGLTDLAQRYTLMPTRVDLLKHFIAERARPVTA